jgi:hypothetical protein
MQTEGSPFPLPSHLLLHLSQLVNFQWRQDGLHYPSYIFLDKNGTMTALFVWFLNTSRITPVFLLLSPFYISKKNSIILYAIQIFLFILKHCTVHYYHGSQFYFRRTLKGLANILTLLYLYCNAVTVKGKTKRTIRVLELRLLFKY